MNNIERVKEQLKKHNLLERYLELPSSTATVSLAAQTIGCEEDLIAAVYYFCVFRIYRYIEFYNNIVFKADRVFADVAGRKHLNRIFFCVYFAAVLSPY